MKTIKALLVKSGVSEEAANKICESLESHVDQSRQQLETQFNERVAKVKSICLKETEDYKSELARRVQIFLETKSATIQESLSRQLGNKETEATATLRRVKASLNGVEMNSEPNSQLQTELKNAKKLLEGKTRQLENVSTQLRRVQAISDKLLTRNRILEHTQVSKVATESVAAKPGNIRRSSGKPVTTRRTLVENQDRTPPKNGVKAGFPKTPEEIAASME